MQAQPYLLFNGCCEEAVEFYRSTLDAQVSMLMHYKDAPADGGTGCSGMEPVAGDRVIHASFQIGDTTVMASDYPTGDAPALQGFSLALSVADPAEAERKFAALSAGGKVQAPLSKTFFSPSFGMVVDKFGVSWMVLVPQSQ